MKLGDRITKRVPIILAPNLNHQLIFAWAWCSSLWSNMSNRFQILTYPTLHCSSTRSISISPLSRCLFDHLLLRIEVRQFRLGAMDESWEMFRCSNWLCNWSRIEMKIYLDYLCISKSIIWLLLYYILYTQAMLHTNPGLMGRSHWLCSECWNSCRIPDSRHPCVPLVLPQWALHLPPRHSCMADPDRSSKSSTKINHLKSLRKGRVNIPNPNSPKTKTLVSGNKQKHKRRDCVSKQDWMSWSRGGYRFALRFTVVMAPCNHSFGGLVLRCFLNHGPAWLGKQSNLDMSLHLRKMTLLSQGLYEGISGKICWICDMCFFGNLQFWERVKNTTKYPPSRLVTWTYCKLKEHDI